MKLEHTLMSYTKINSRLKDITIRFDTLKLLEENIGTTLCSINHNNILLDPFPSIMETKTKINKRDIIKLKSFYTAAAAKSLQSCLTLCDPIDSSPPGSLVPGILQARTLEWVAISFSNAWKWKWSCSVMSDPQRPHGLQPSMVLHPWDFPGKSTGVGCHCLLCFTQQRKP